MKKLATFLCALFIAFAVSVAAPSAQAQTNDCTDLQRVLDETGTPEADAAAEAVRASVHSAVQAGLAALQCARADGDGRPVAVEINPQFAAPGYQSRCPPATPAPAPPPAPAQVPQAEFNAAVTAFNAWAETFAAGAACRRAEIAEISNLTAVAAAALIVWNRRTEQQGAAIVADFQARSRPRSR